MQVREYIVDGNLIDSLGSLVMTFGIFFTLTDGVHPKLILSENKVILNEYFKEEYKNSKYKSENLNQFVDFLRCIASPMDGTVGEGDHILIRIINSDSLKKILGFEVAEEQEKKNLEGYIRDFPNDEKGINYCKAIYEAAKNRVPGNTMFDKILLIIISTKKVRLQLD